MPRQDANPGPFLRWIRVKELALLEAGHGPGMAGLVGSLPVGSRVLALVSEDDIEELETLAGGPARQAGKRWW